MRVLILGASGMLGHKLLEVTDGSFDVRGTLRSGSAPASLKKFPLFFGVHAEEFPKVEHVIASFAPDAVVNCIGVVKQLKSANPEALIQLNSLLPHRLARACASHGVRLIHVSTDCVFSGRKGNYNEEDVPDPIDLYGRSKLLGEIDAPGCVTVRTSFIGRELDRHTSLIDWFLGQRGKTVRGFTRAIYSGLTAQALSREIVKILLKFPDMHGVWHVGADPISKYDLLSLVNEAFGLEVDLQRDADFVCDRSFTSFRYRSHTGFKPLSWKAMIDELASGG